MAGGAVLVHSLSQPAHISLAADAGHQHAGGHEHGRGGLGSGGAGHFRFQPRWSFSTLDNQNDPTFNQLLGINNRGEIAGYFGSGAQGHPNKGYLLFLPSQRRSRFVSENVPGAVQTQVTGLNDRGTTVGFFSTQNTASMMNNNFGFYTWAGRFHTVNFPTRKNAEPPVNQLLGVNDANVAVGFWTDANGSNHGYVYSITGHVFRTMRLPFPAPSATATGINNEGAVSGFFTGPGGVTRAFVKGPGGRVTRLTFPGATMTQAFGINDLGEVVGTYTTGSGKSAMSFGFTWTARAGFRSVSDPLGKGTTTINGVNDKGDLVGFYADAAGNTHGLLLAQGHFMAPPAPPVAPVPAASMSAAPTMSAMPTMTPTPSMSAMPTMTPTGPPTTPPAPTAPPQPGPSSSPPSHW